MPLLYFSASPDYRQIPELFPTKAMPQSESRNVNGGAFLCAEDSGCLKNTVFQKDIYIRDFRFGRAMICNYWIIITYPK